MVVQEDDVTTMRRVLSDARLMTLGSDDSVDFAGRVHEIGPRISQPSMWRWFSRVDYWTAFALARELGYSIAEIVSDAGHERDLIREEEVIYEMDMAMLREQRVAASALSEQASVLAMRRLGRPMLDTFWSHVLGWGWATPPGRARFSVREDIDGTIAWMVSEKTLKIFIVNFAKVRYLTAQFPQARKET